MISYLALLLIAGVQASDAQPRTVVVQSGPLDIPDEIAPAVLPYMACLTAAKGSPLRNGPGGPEAFPGRFNVGEDCSGMRAEAAVNADRMLKGTQSKKKRSGLIESTLSSIDNFVGSMPKVSP